MTGASTTDARKRRDEGVEAIIPLGAGGVAAQARKNIEAAGEALKALAAATPGSDSTFSGKTEYLWGILRPDGKAVMTNPSTGRTGWKVDKSLSIAGCSDDPDVDAYERSVVQRQAATLTDELVNRGVAREAALHTAVLFEIVTQVRVADTVEVDA